MANGEHTLNGVFNVYLAIVLGWSALQALSMRAKTAKWEQVRGTMVSQIDYKIFGFTYNCEVKYKYEVERVIFYGSRTDNWKSDTNPYLCSILSKSKGRNRINVYYNPKKPSQSILDNSLDPLYFVILIEASLYFTYLGLMSFQRAEFIPLTVAMTIVFTYLLFTTGLLLWVGISNIRENFSSAFLALCMGLYFSASIGKGIHDTRVSISRIQNMSQRRGQASEETSLLRNQAQNSV